MQSSAPIRKHPFHIPKRRVKVRVELLNGSTLTGAFYANQLSSSGGPGRVSDRLNNDGEPFIPLAVEENHVLVRKTVISTIQLENEPWETPQQASNTTELRLRVKMTNGSVTRGSVIAVLPRERSRALDYLNGNEDGFFAMVAGNNRVTLVNSRHVESVTEYDPSA